MQPRALARRISIGRLIPAITSTLPLFISEIARLEGVPPNRSVSTITPAPASTVPIASAISRRRASMSSLGPMQTVATASCRPTTCCIALTNSSASLPWVTRIMPIMQVGGSEVRPCHGRTNRPGKWRSPMQRIAAHGQCLPSIGVGERAMSGCGGSGSGHSPALRSASASCSARNDRAVPPAGAAEGDVDIGLALRLVAREQQQHQLADPLQASAKAGSLRICSATAGIAVRSAGAGHRPSADCRETACRTPDRRSAACRAKSRSW